MRYYSFSRVETYLKCSYLYYLKYIERLKPVNVSSNLIYGNIIHSIVEQSFLTPDFTSDDAKAKYFDLLNEAKANNCIQFSQRFDEKTMDAIGENLASQTPDTVRDSGFELFEINGKPSSEVKFEAGLTDEVGYMGYIDLFVFHPIRGETGLIDVKSSAQGTVDFLPYVSNQLTGYSMVDILHQFPKVDFVAFWDFIKRKVSNRSAGPEIKPMVKAPCPTSQQRQDYAEQIIWIDNQIQAQHFFKQPRSNYDTPCAMCDMREYCHNGDRSFLK